MSELEFNIDNAQIGFRLHSLEVLNWGTFHESIWKIEPNGNNSLLTGDVGSGKSTIVDALTCLLVPHQKITFNKAAGAESKERSILSYVKGEYKNTKNDDGESREKAVTLRYNRSDDSTFSVIVANFTNKGYQSSVSLAQVFWIENDKAHKLLLIREILPFSVKEHFTGIDDARALRKKLKELSHVEIFDDNFSKYSQRFRQLFGMNSEKAIDLFYQTVSMKSVSSLTSFVKGHMLEKTDIKSQIEDLKKRFDDLNKAYASVQQARKQRDVLSPLVKFSEDFRAFQNTIESIDNFLQAFPSFFAAKKQAILEKEIRELERKLLQLEGQLNSLETQLNNKRDTITDIKQNIRENGGTRLEQIAGEIKQHEIERDKKRQYHKSYTELTNTCDLESSNSDVSFFRNKKNAEAKLTDLKTRQIEILEKHGQLAGKKANINEDIERVTKELESLKIRPNQIPLEYLNLRKKLSEDLEIPEEEIPFAGELMKVLEREKEWEGALERLLRGFGISMLVPDKHYRIISQYVNTRTMQDRNKRLKLDYFAIPYKFNYTENDHEIDDDSAVSKIDIKPDPLFADWIQNELETRFNLRCVSLDEFQRQRRDVMTKEGQFKKGKRHTKDDRHDLWDRMNFVLGWENNKEKVAALSKHLDSIKAEKNDIERHIASFATEIKTNTDSQGSLQRILAFNNWYELNWQDEASAITDLEKERYELENSNDVLKTLNTKLNAVSKEINELETERSTAEQVKGNVEGKLKEYYEDVIDCDNTVDLLQPAERDKYFSLIDKEIENIELSIKNIIKVRDDLFRKKNAQRDTASKSQNGVRDKIIRQMKEFNDQFPSDSLDLSPEIESLPEYLWKLDKILTEGLPAHEATLKTMLNKNTIDDIVAFDNKLDIHEKAIKDKIRNINEHLKAIEFNRGTYIELIADRNRDLEIKRFKEDLKACYSNILDTNDAYTEGRFNDVQRILNRFRSNDSKDIDWTSKVTDVRNWFDFNASERYLATNEEKEFYVGSSGKSGGQKEKLAYTIIASALAYQFGLTYGEPKSKSFRFAVIDEAFGKGSDSSAEYGLELFKKLNLQLLIVTPLQKIHIIENYITAVHHVANPDGNYSEIQNLTIEEYKTDKHLHNGVVMPAQTNKILDDNS
jgi:uncharacterized protein YPO0396